MKIKKNIFENKLQELNKLKIDSKKEVLAKEQKEKDDKKKAEEFAIFETRKFLKEYDKERSELKKFIKEVNKKFYKKYEINVINPSLRKRDGMFCRDTGGYNNTYYPQHTGDYKCRFEINIFSLDVLYPPFNNEDQKTTDIELKYINSTDSFWPSRFKVEVGDSFFKRGNYTEEDFYLRDHGPKAIELALNDFMNKLTNLIKIL